MFELEDLKDIAFFIILATILVFVGVMTSCLIDIEKAITLAKDNCIVVNEEIYCKK